MKEITLAEVKKLREAQQETVYIKQEEGKYYLLTFQEYKSKHKTGCPCITCKHGHIGMCPKIGYKGQRKIENFLFAKESYEIISTKAQNCNLVIKECENYESEEYISTKEERDKLVKQFVYSYYGVNNSMELYQELRRIRW